MAFHGAARRRLTELGATRCHLSLTHAGGVAAAVVILE
jgi:phosphopantetheinyl transferase (holo-ACP synthase)